MPRLLPILCVAVLACEPPRRSTITDTPATPVAAPDTVRRTVVRVLRRPSAIERVTGALSVHRALVPLDTVLAVRILDRRGASLHGVRVAWSLGAVGAGARLDVIRSETDSDGVATAAFVPGTTGDAQHVFAEVPDVGRIDFAVVVQAAAMQLLPRNATLWSGDSDSITASLRDSAGLTLRGGTMQWVSTDTAVVRVSGSDGPRARITAVGAGAADVIAAMVETRAAARIVVRPEVHLQFLMLDSNPPPRMHLEIWSGVLLDSATVADGSYARRVEGVGDDVEIRARETGQSSVQDVAVRVQRPRDLQGLRIVLVPRVWHINRGTYAGLDVPIDAAAAMRRSSAVFWRLVPISGRGPRHLLGWSPDKFPLHLAFNHSSTARVSAEDSVAFWGVARQMERDLGMALFAPAELADSARGEVTPVEIRAQSGEGHTYVTWSDAGDAYDAVVLFRDEATMRDPQVVTHELLHLIGFGHTLAWPSVARPAGGKEAHLTPVDVAYVQLAIRLRDVQRRTGARPGLPISRQ